MHGVVLLLTAHHLQAWRLCKQGDQSVMEICPPPPAPQGSWASPISAQGAYRLLISHLPGAATTAQLGCKEQSWYPNPELPGSHPTS